MQNIYQIIKDNIQLIQQINENNLTLCDSFLSIDEKTRISLEMLSDYTDSTYRKLLKQFSEEENDIHSVTN
jgi:hypothetical protein